jgi:hypothetical protein
MRLDLDRLAHLTGPLTRFFYALMAVALLSVLLGAPGSALFFLVVGAAAQVLRAAIQELVWERQNGTAAPASARPPAARRDERRPPARAGGAGGRRRVPGTAARAG